MGNTAKVRDLSQGEKDALIKIISSSKHRHASSLIGYVASAKVRCVNEDGSILAFCKETLATNSIKQRILEPTGYVEDDLGIAGEVILFVDETVQLSELEIVSIGEDIIGPPRWETFRVAQ